MPPLERTHPAHARCTTIVTVLSTLLALILPRAADAQVDDTKFDAHVRITYDMIRDGASPDTLHAHGASVNPLGQLTAFVYAGVTRSILESAGAIVHSEGDSIFTVDFPDTFAVIFVSNMPDVYSIEGAPYLGDDLDVSVPTTRATVQRGPGPNFNGLNGGGVLIGVVDSGFDLAHDDFMFNGGTRFIKVWDQSDAGVDPGPPPGFRYGTEWSTQDIDNVLYRQVDANGHGSHVTGIAAGNGSAAGGGSAPAHTFVGMAPRADLIGVKSHVPNTLVVQERDFPYHLATRVVDGVRYVFKKADSLGQDCVVNLSLGTQYGPHDGSSPFERAIGRLVKPGRLIVKSAGNDANKNAHAEVMAVNGGASATFEVPANGGTVGISGYYDGAANLTVTVTSPGGTVVGPVARGARDRAYPGVATGADGLCYVENGMNGTVSGKRQIYIELNNTAAGASTSGTWTITLTRVAGPAQIETDLWKFRPRKAEFKFVNGLDNQETISEPGNADSLITVGAYTTKLGWTDCNDNVRANPFGQTLNQIGDFSSLGPTSDNRLKPDITAPGSAIGSTLSADTNPICPAGAALSLDLKGLHHTMDVGTSMAAPHVTGACALILQKYGSVSARWVKLYLRDNALVDAQTGLVPNNTWGHGKLRLAPGGVIDSTHYWSYTVLSPLDTSITVLASDQFLPFQPLQIDGLDRMLNWVQKNGSTVRDTALHFTWWNLQNRIPVRRHATLDNQFGTFGVTIDTLAFLLAPAAKNDPSGPSEYLSHYLCYDARPTPGPGTLYSFYDEWRFATYPVQMLRYVCAPCLKYHDGREFAPVDTSTHFAVYRVPATSDVFQPVLEDQFQLGQYFVRQQVPEYLFVPSLKTRVTGVETGDEELFGMRAAPNPGLGGTAIRFRLPLASRVTVDVLDIGGRRVRTLARDQMFEAGAHTIAWDGRSTAGARLPAGMYFVRLRDGSRVEFTRVVLRR